MARRQHLTLTILLAVVVLLSLTYLMSGSSYRDNDATKSALENKGLAQDTAPVDFGISQDILSGGAIAPKLENATAKAELGRASWKLMHTMMARFPEKPTPEESLALKTYVQLFSRLYPCGDCASHFQKLLAKYPPQTSSRNAAAGWACFVHNQVNERLGKDIFDCNNIGDFYDCGCGDEDKEKGKDGAAAGEDVHVSLEKDGLTKGG